LETNDVQCNASGIDDIDSDPVTLSYEWFVNNNLVGEDDKTLSSIFTAPGDQIFCKVTPFDGIEFGSTVTSNTFAVFDPSGGGGGGGF